MIRPSRTALRLGLAGRREPDGVEDDLVWVRDLFPVVAEMRDRIPTQLVVTKARAGSTISLRG